MWMGYTELTLQKNTKNKSWENINSMVRQVKAGYLIKGLLYVKDWILLLLLLLFESQIHRFFDVKKLVSFFCVLCPLVDQITLVIYCEEFKTVWLIFFFLKMLFSIFYQYQLSASTVSSLLHSQETRRQAYQGDGNLGTNSARKWAQ